MTTNQMERSKARSHAGGGKSSDTRNAPEDRAGRAVAESSQIQEFLKERNALQERVLQLEKHLGEIASVVSKTTMHRIPPSLRALVHIYSGEAGKKAPPVNVTRSARDAGADGLAAAQPSQDSAQHGHAQLIAWTNDGTLVPSKQFAALRGKSPQALHKAVARGELFSFKVNGNLYYPAALANLPDDALIRLCVAIGPLDKVQKLAFVLRKHGALSGAGVAQAIAAGRTERVIELAEARAAEYGAAA